MKILKKIFDHEYKELEKFKELANQVEQLDSKMAELTDKQLKNKIDYLKASITTAVIFSPIELST